MQTISGLNPDLPSSKQTDSDWIHSLDLKGLILLCECVVKDSRQGGRHVRAGRASRSPALMTACLLSSGPLGCCPFPSLLCALIGHKCSCLMLLSCLVSSDAECDVGVGTGIWNGYNEIAHLGRRVVSCLEYHVRVRYICCKSPVLLSWEEPRPA